MSNTVDDQAARPESGRAGRGKTALVSVLILLAGTTIGRGTAGFATFRHHPVRAILLAVVTLLVIGLLWLGALLLGFFITGLPAALLTWLAFGVVGVLLLTAWTSLASRSPIPGHSAHGR